MRFSRGLVSGQGAEGCWVDTRIEKLEGGTILRGKGVEKVSMTIIQEIMAMGCEMCRPESSEAALTRIEHCGFQDSREILFPYPGICSFVIILF